MLDPDLIGQFEDTVGEAGKIADLDPGRPSPDDAARFRRRAGELYCGLMIFRRIPPG